MAFVVGLYVFEWSVYNFVCRPETVYAVIFNLLMAMAIWSYLATSLTDPGTPACEEWQKWRMFRSNHSPSSKAPSKETKRGWTPGEVTWCNSCDRERPERAHHCSYCEVCVLRMDHYCPWVGTCVGWRNQKQFILMTWWTFWSCVAMIFTMRNPTAWVAMMVVLEPDDKRPNILPMLGILVAFVFGVATCIVFVTQFYMTGRNRTSVEDFYNGENPYEYPNFLDNLRQLFGSLDFFACLPLLPANRLEGTSFPLWPKRPCVEKEGGNATDYGAV